MLSSRFLGAAVCAAFLCSLSTAPAQTARRPVATPAAPASAPAPAALTNDDIIGLAGAGLDDSVIVAKIHSAPSTAFDTSVAGLKALKAAGVSTAVIRVMVDPTAASAPAAVAAAAPAAANPDDPQAPHSPGIYMLATTKDGAIHLVKLDHITSKNMKTSGAFLSGMTYGIAKAHVKAAIDGPRANNETIDTNPVFYAYIPEDNNSFGGNSLTIRDFSLIKFDAKSSTREVNTATISPWGSSTGTDEKAKQGFNTESLKTGVYKLTLLKPLPPGEYAFQHQNYGAFFDFGILSGQ
jgi:hypothetical protein